jgi:hypothetical protein
VKTKPGAIRPSQALSISLLQATSSATVQKAKFQPPNRSSFALSDFTSLICYSISPGSGIFQSRDTHQQEYQK